MWSPEYFRGLYRQTEKSTVATVNNVSTLLPSEPQYGKGKGFSIMISFLDESLDLLSFSN